MADQTDLQDAAAELALAAVNTEFDEHRAAAYSRACHLLEVALNGAPQAAMQEAAAALGEELTNRVLALEAQVEARHG